jgi:hypothetical protein
VPFLAATAITFEVDRVIPGITLCGQSGGDSRGLDAGNGADFRQKPVKKPFSVGGISVKVVGEAHVDREDTAGIKAFIDLNQPREARCQEAGNDQ